MRAEISVPMLVALIAITATTAAGLALLDLRTKLQIQQNQRAWELRQIEELLDQHEYDNDVFNDLVWIASGDSDSQLLGEGDQHFICRASQQGKPNAAVLQVTAANGYSGPIKLLVGINMDGTLAGVRVTSHRETPGLGDRIEITKSDWIKQFKGRSLQNPEPAMWRVKKDGGEFDQITGATVTPRAITVAVKKALDYFALHRHEIFSRPVNSQVPADE